MSVDGDRVRARRERLGLDKRRLAAEARVSRETLAAIEKGEGFRHSSLTKLERVLDDYEAEAGITEPIEVATTPSLQVVIIRLKNDAGEVVFEGPPENQAQMVADAQRLLDHMRQAMDDE